MARSIYATFETEHDAERASGALIDHGVATVDISFVVSHSLLHPTVFHPDAVPTSATALPVQVAAPPPTRLPGTYPASPTPSAATVMPDHLAASMLQAQDPRTAVPLGAVTMPANTPEELAHDARHPHIIDMESDRPKAADGISTTTAGDAAKGAAGGAGIGIGLGVLLGLATVMIPGIGLVAGAGALIAGLAAATGVAGGIAGGVFGYLTDLGIPTEHAKLLSDNLKPGGVLLHIQVTGVVPEDEILRTLTKYGATSAQGF